MLGYIFQEDTPHFSLGDESDDEASMMYVKEQYLNSAPTGKSWQFFNKCDTYVT